MVPRRCVNVMTLLCETGDTTRIQRRALVSMQERVQAIGAQVRITSQPGATAMESVNKMMLQPAQNVRKQLFFQ